MRIFKDVCANSRLHLYIMQLVLSIAEFYILPHFTYYCMPEYNFEHKTVLVTGGARGLGRSHAIEFAKAGADIAIIDLPEQKDVEYKTGTASEAEEVVSEIRGIGQRAVAFGADVSFEEQVESAVDKITNEFDEINILINNAGAFPVSDLLEMDEDTWDVVLDTNLKGSWLCAKHIGNHMIKEGIEGEIVNTASFAGKKGIPIGLGHYVASKHGLLGLTKSLALELAEYNINVNAVCPGATESQGITEIAKTYGEEPTKKTLELGGPYNVLNEGELLTAKEISDAVMWLTSDSTPHVTGEDLAVDAGFTAR